MPLIQTNPNLKDPINLEKMIFKNVVSSTAIELISIKQKFIKRLKKE